MQKVLMSLFLSCVGGLVGAFAGVLIVQQIFQHSQSVAEANTSWVLLDSPMKFTQIVGVYIRTVWAQTADGKLYYWNLTCATDPICKDWKADRPYDYDGKDSYCAPELKCKEWTETESFENDSGFIERNTTCSFPQAGYQVEKEPPGNTVVCLLDRPNKYYALLDNGTIWYWETPILGDGTEGSVGVFLGGLLGIVGGIAIGSVINKRQINH